MSPVMAPLPPVVAHRRVHGVRPAGPVRAATPPGDRDPFGAVLEEAPPVAVTIAITGGAVAVVVVLGGVSVAAWAAGVVIDALRGRP